MSEDWSTARSACTVGASQLKERVSAMVYAQSTPLRQDALIAAVKEALPASLSVVHHHHNLLGVLLFENETNPQLNGGCSVYVAAAAMDTLALRRGGVSPGKECVWCTGEPPGQRRYFDATSNILEYTSAKTTPRPGSPRAARRGASLASSSPSSASWQSMSIARRKPWVADCLRSGPSWTSPYPDPVTGRLIESYVIPIESSHDAQAILGVIVAGSLLVDYDNHLNDAETVSRNSYPSPTVQLPLPTPTAVPSKAEPVQTSIAASESSRTVVPTESHVQELPAKATLLSVAVNEGTAAVMHECRTGVSKVASAPASVEGIASVNAAEPCRTSTTREVYPPGSNSTSTRESREMLFNGVKLSRGLSASKYASFFAERPPRSPLLNLTSTQQRRATLRYTNSERDKSSAASPRVEPATAPITLMDTGNSSLTSTDSMADVAASTPSTAHLVMDEGNGAVTKHGLTTAVSTKIPATAPAAMTIGDDSSVAAASSGELLRVRNNSGFGSTLRGRQAPPPLTVPNKARLADASSGDIGTGKGDSESGPESGTGLGSKISSGPRNGRSRSQSPRGHGYRSPPLLSSPLTTSLSSADWVVHGPSSNRGNRVSGGSKSSNASSRSSSDRGGWHSTGSVLLSSPRTAPWLEVDLAKEMELEHGLVQSLAQPSPPAAAAPSPVEEVPVPVNSTIAEAHPATANSLSESDRDATVFHASTQSNLMHVSPHTSPKVPSPAPLVAQVMANTRQSPSPPPADETIFTGSSLAARSAELLSRARSERSRLRKLRILINESSPERLAAVLSTEPLEAAKARGKAAADLDARGAALAAARAAAHAAGVKDARANIQRRSLSPATHSSPSSLSPTRQFRDSASTADFDALLALSPEAMGAIHGGGGSNGEEASEERESLGDVSTGPRRRPPQHRTSRRLKRSSARSPPPGPPRGESGSPTSGMSGVPGLSVVTGFLRRFGLGSPVEPSPPSEKSNAATARELQSSEGVPAQVKVAALPAEIRTSTSASPGSSSDNDDDFHSADEGDEG